jgi:PAS domain S-box-containing protein
MPPIAQRLREQIQRMLIERATDRSWGRAIGLAVVTAVAYFLAARAGLSLLKPEGVAVMWPALGLAVGCLIALGSEAWLPVATGICAGIVAARLRAGGSLWIAIALGLCNTGGGLLTAGLIERWFGPAFKLENVSCVLGFLGATAVGTLAAAISGTAVVGITEPTTDVLNVWCSWFTSAALGIVTVAPLPIGLASAMRGAPPRREQVEGATALVTLCVTGAFVMSLPPGPWATAVPVAVVFPIVLWIAVRCRPVFAAAAAFIVALIVAYSTALGLGDFGNASVPLPDRTLAAQTIVLAGALCLLILSALFAERRGYEMMLEDGNRRLQLVLAQREEAERALSDRNTQLALAGKVALVGSYAYDVNADEMHVSDGYAAIHGLPEGTTVTTRSAWRRRVYPEDLGRVQGLRSRALRDGACEHNFEYRIVFPDRGVRWIESRSFIVLDGTGNAQRVIGINIDVTDRKQTEARLSDALAAGQVVAFEWDAVTGRSQRSDNADRVIGFVEDGRFLQQVHPDYRGNLKALVRSLSPDNPSYSATFQFDRSDGRQVWQEETGKGEFDRTGRLLRIKGLTRDITERKQAELALAERNTQLALAGKAGLVATFAYDVKTGRVQISEGYAAIYGFPEGTTEIARSQWRALVLPDDLERLESRRKQAFSDRQREYRLEYRVILPDGGVRWIETRSFVSYDGEGRPQRVAGVNIDVTERRRMEQILTDRNRQLQLAGKAALVGSFAIDIDAVREDFSSQHLQFSPGFAAIYGLPEETVEISVGDWRSLVHPDDIAQFLEHRQELFAERRGEHHAEFRIVRPCGTIRWIETRSFVEYDQAGHAKRLVGVNIDITERKRAEEGRKILNAELDHRVKNALATVTAVISHTRQGSRSVADFAAALEGRIRSMAATHELLSSRHWQELSLIELIRRELAPYAASKNTEISGPTVLLKPEAGQALAMVLHELATNAAKYGALSTNKGRVLIHWDRRLNGRPLSNLVLEWREVGGPRVDAPGKSSYGTNTIHDLIPYEFGGTVDLVFAPEGVRCRLELPPDWMTHMGEPTEALADTTR